jgi:hypothetical protein
MSHIDYPAFDADNHYYEAEDAFTRHIEPKMQRRAMQWGVVNGRKSLLVAGKVNRFIPNPTSTRREARAASTSTSAAAIPKARAFARCSATSSRSTPPIATAMRASR